jgi:hypothetical protein
MARRPPSPPAGLFAAAAARDAALTPAARRTGVTLVAWILIQLADTVGPRLHLPEWSITLIIVMALTGLPLSIVLAWAFDITPEGMRRTPPRRRASRRAAQRDAAPSPPRGRIDSAIWRLSCCWPSSDSAAARGC